MPAVVAKYRDGWLRHHSFGSRSRRSPVARLLPRQARKGLALSSFREATDWSLPGRRSFERHRGPLSLHSLRMATGWSATWLQQAARGKAERRLDVAAGIGRGQSIFRLLW